MRLLASSTQGEREEGREGGREGHLEAEGEEGVDLQGGEAVGVGEKPHQALGCSPSDLRRPVAGQKVFEGLREGGREGGREGREGLGAAWNSTEKSIVSG